MVLKNQPSQAGPVVQEAREDKVPVTGYCVNSRPAWQLSEIPISEIQKALSLSRKGYT